MLHLTLFDVLDFEVVLILKIFRFVRIDALPAQSRILTR